MNLLPPSRHRARVLAARARALREFPALSEERLWRELSGERLGVGFRRQVPVAGRFIADFLAPALRLVVEVDGSAHVHKRRADARRDEALRRLGFHVVRIPVEVVVRDLTRAVARVREEVERLRG